MRIRFGFGILGVLALLAVGVVSPSGTAKAATLHALVVIDTNDRRIGTMVARDMNLMAGEIRKIAAASGLALNSRTYKGSDFTIAKVRGAVQALSPGRDDVVLFYYSGHGFRTKTKRSRWPFFFFHSNTQAIDFGWVIRELSAKGARLTIALTDACNNVVPLQIREEQKALQPGATKAQNGYRDLFLGFKGLVAGTSSIPGETSTATQSGSLFTLAFLKALQKEVVQSRPDWNALMQNAAGRRLSVQNSRGQTMSQQPFHETSVARMTPAQPPIATPRPPSPLPVVTPQPPTTRPTWPPQPPAPTVRRPQQPAYPAARPRQPASPGGDWQVIN